jgi:hypothetical protein
MKNPAAVALGTLGGKAKSEAKAKSSAANGVKGGRPLKKTLKCEVCGHQKPRDEIVFSKYSITKRGQTCKQCLEELSESAHKHHMGEQA